MSDQVTSRPSRSVVVTGLGAVSALGIGIEPFWQGLLNNQSGVRRITHYDPTGLPIDFGGEVPGFEPKQHIRPRKSLKVMSREIQLAFTAADIAWQQAQLTTGVVPSERVGVVMGADMIYFDPPEVQDAVRASMVDGQFQFNRWATHGMSQMFPLALLKYLPNMPGCHVAIAHEARAACNSICLGEVSSLVALAEGVRYIERGLADVVLVGGVGYQLNPSGMIFRDVFEMARGTNPEQLCRPFDAQRTGMVFGEGAGVLVIESAEHAQLRQAPILAHIAATAIRHEPTRRGRPLTGSAMRLAIEACLRSAAISPQQLSSVHAHGEATRAGDAAEATAIAQSLPGVPVWAIKGATGHAEAGSSALELVASVLSVHQQVLPPTRNCDQIGADCPVEIVRGEPRTTTADYHLKLSTARTGQAAAVLFQRVTN